MAMDKMYPLSNKDGKPLIDRAVTSTATRRYGDADLYKAAIASQFNVEGNIVPTRVSGALWGPKAKIYDELSSAVTAIERGQKDNWHPRNWISGMNNPSLDVTNASIELLEICREELMKIDEINKDPRWNAQEKKAKIAEQKAYVFGLLADIRNANARERTFQWSRDFFSSLGKNFRPELNKTNISLAVIGLGICVALPIVGAAALAAAYVLPVVFGLFCVFALCKLVQGVYNSWQDANKLATKSKNASGDKILSQVAMFKEKNLSIPRQERDAAKVEMDSTQQLVTEHQKQLAAELEKLKVPILQKIDVLTLENAELEQVILKQRQIIATPVKRGVNKATRDEECLRTITGAEDKIRNNKVEQGRLTLTELPKYAVMADASNPALPVLDANTKLLPQISAILAKLTPVATALPGKVKTHADKEKACLAAEQSAKQSRARASKTPDPTTASRKTLKEILDDGTGPDGLATPRKTI
ncbi:MAG: hypothetical protein KBB94_06715 [Legionellaceae bacterium]|nr:hypothetical protein [Legionellaceae bacterium]MBP9775348.1 hypothetical protein [Legionellaceae bacterium]